MEVKTLKVKGFIEIVVKNAPSPYPFVTLNISQIRSFHVEMRNNERVTVILMATAGEWITDLHPTQLQNMINEAMQ